MPTCAPSDWTFVTSANVAGIHAYGPSSPGTRFVDSIEERSFGINPKGEKAGLEVWTFEPDPNAKTEVLASAFRGGAAVGASVTRLRRGKGAVYAIGHDLASFGATRCYLNCFEPAGDVMRLMFDGALREASQGHVAVLATTPALASSVLVLTHDVNTHESQFSGNWGEAGAIQFAKIEKERGIHATFHVMTDYRGNHFNAKMVRELCALDMCPAGIQGVARVPQFARIPNGMVRDSDANNRSFTTLRINPMRGEGLMPENLQAKAVMLGRFLDQLARSHPDVVVRSVHEAGDFWRARGDAKLEARFDKATGYVGTLTIGKTTSPGIAIEFGDAIKSFDCAKCGETKIAGTRVAIVSALPSGTKVEFAAKVE